MQSLEPDWDLDSDMEIRMSEFESRLHEVEAANLQQNSTWFSKFQAIEIKLAQLHRRVVELPQPDAVQGGRQIAELRAAVDTLVKTCAADKAELLASIDKSTSRYSHEQSTTQQKLAQISSHECEAAAAATRLVQQLQESLLEMQQESTRVQQKQADAQKKIEAEIAQMAGKCDKRAAQCREEHEGAVQASAAETEISDTIADATESLEQKLEELQSRISTTEASSKQQQLQTSTSLSSKLTQLEQQLTQTLTQKLKTDMAQMLASHKCSHAPIASPREPVKQPIKQSSAAQASSRFPHVRSMTDSGGPNTGTGRRGSVKMGDGLSVGNSRAQGETGVQGLVPRVKHIMY